MPTTQPKDSHGPHIAICSGAHQPSGDDLIAATRAPAAVADPVDALRRSRNIHRQPVHIDKATRCGRHGHAACVLWLTGLSGSGKSTIATALEKRLFALGLHTYLLDGDNLRHGLSRDLGFSDADRVENIRRVAEVAQLMVDAGLVVIVALISPFEAGRAAARRLVDAGEFLEVFVDTPLDVAEQRDPKGLYRKARSGQLVNFTGIDAPYEPPREPDVRLDTTRLTVEAAVDVLIAALRERQIIASESSVR